MKLNVFVNRSSAPDACWIFYLRIFGWIIKINPQAEVKK